MALAALPSELILRIADFLSVPELSALILCSNRLATLLTPWFYDDVFLFEAVWNNGLDTPGQRYHHPDHYPEKMKLIDRLFKCAACWKSARILAYFSSFALQRVTEKRYVWYWMHRRFLGWDRTHPPEDLLSNLCRVGSKEILKVFLDRGLDIRLFEHSEDGYTTPLNLVAFGGHLDLLQLLLERGVNLFVTDTSGCGALYWVVSEREPSRECHAVALFILSRYDAGVLPLIDKPGPGEVLSLFQRIAGQDGAIQVIESMIAKGANVSESNYLERALYEALSPEDESVAQLLLDHILLVQKSADPVVPWNGTNHLAQAVHWNRQSVVQRLLKEAEAGSIAVDPNKHFVLHDLVTKSAFGVPELETVKKLIDMGASVNTKRQQSRSKFEDDDFGFPHWRPSRSVLDLAIRHFRGEQGPRLEMVKVILRLTDDLTFVDENNGNTLLHLVAKQKSQSPEAAGAAEIMQLLISRGLDVNARNDWGKTPLHCAAASLYKVKVMKVLIENGAEVDAT